MNARARLPYLTALSAALLFAAPLCAQNLAGAPVPAATVSTDSVSSAPATAGPTRAAASVAVRRNMAETNTMLPPAPNGGYGQPIAMMVAGGAAVVVGIVVGGGPGYAISIGGAVIGLIGLYQYMQ